MKILNYPDLKNYVELVVSQSAPERVGVRNIWVYVSRKVSESRAWGAISNKEARKLNRKLAAVERFYCQQTKGRGRRR